MRYIKLQVNWDTEFISEVNMLYINLYVIGHKDFISWVKNFVDHSDRCASNLPLRYGSSNNRFCLLYVDLLVIGHEDSNSWV